MRAKRYNKGVGASHGHRRSVKSCFHITAAPSVAPLSAVIAVVKIQKSQIWFRELQSTSAKHYSYTRFLRLCTGHWGGSTRLMCMAVRTSWSNYIVDKRMSFLSNPGTAAAKNRRCGGLFSISASWWHSSFLDLLSSNPNGIVRSLLLTSTSPVYSSTFFLLPIFKHDLRGDKQTWARKQHETPS